MGIDELLKSVLALVVGLLLGSVLPAELLARRHGVDIRSVGDGNPGTVNAFKGLGPGLGLVVALYDILVGVIAIAIARLLGLSDGVAYLAGLMSVLGHRFPVFHGFKDGGQGMAASAGLLLYALGVALSRGWLSLPGFAALVGIGGLTFALTRADTAIAVTVLPVFVGLLAFAPTGWAFMAFAATAAGHIWVTQVIATRRHLPFQGIRPLRGQTPS